MASLRRTWLHRPINWTWRTGPSGYIIAFCLFPFHKLAHQARFKLAIWIQWLPYWWLVCDILAAWFDSHATVCACSLFITQRRWCVVIAAGSVNCQCTHYLLIGSEAFRCAVLNGLSARHSNCENVRDWRCPMTSLRLKHVTFFSKMHIYWPQCQMWNRHSDWWARNGMKPCWIAVFHCVR